MRIFSALLLGIAAACPTLLLAQELSPRAYWPAPEGTRLIQFGYAHTSGDTVPDPSLPFAGFDSDINSYYLGYLHTLNLWGNTSNFIMEIPYVDGETSVLVDSKFKKNRQYKGVGDIDLTLSLNFSAHPQ